MQQRFRVNHNAIADHALFAGMQHPRRKQMQHKLPVADFDGMPGVMPALITGDHIEFICQHIYNFAFALVAPLHPKNY
ncbi:hypothetical protein U14_02307 [Candidatus Moduliflexus flocculans]|uniref:Uncharacterized protein n=1 Tax=Candidatus Moduliflexus flocculans TaxID=1499966 RepID=A0A0S6VYM8_9BACT|nr:hypothetical protein U14_02307 [Candidatus Moduliflexus flocculans]